MVSPTKLKEFSFTVALMTGVKVRLNLLPVREPSSCNVPPPVLAVVAPPQVWNCQAFAFVDPKGDATAVQVRSMPGVPTVPSVPAVASKILVAVAVTLSPKVAGMLVLLPPFGEVPGALARITVRAEEIAGSRVALAAASMRECRTKARDRKGEFIMTTSFNERAQNRGRPCLCHCITANRIGENA